MADNTRVERAIRLFTHYIRMAAEGKMKLWDSDNSAEIRELVELLMEPPEGKPGSGVCICAIPPAYLEQR